MYSIATSVLLVFSIASSVLFVYSVSTSALFVSSIYLYFCAVVCPLSLFLLRLLVYYCRLSSKKIAACIMCGGCVQMVS